MKKIWYSLSASVFIILLVLVFIREKRDNYFKMETEQVYSMSMDNSVIVGAGELDKFVQKPVIVSLSEPGSLADSIQMNYPVRFIHPDELLSKENKRFYRQNEGLIVLFSSREGMAAQAWIILTKKGFNPVSVLDVDEGERLHYTFKASE